MENGPSEDVFPIKKWGYSIGMLVYQRVRERSPGFLGKNQAGWELGGIFSLHEIEIMATPTRNMALIRPF